MDRNGKLRFDYEQVLGYWRVLKEIRFKLLAIVPTLAGVGVSLLSEPRSPEVGIAVGLLGFVATLGVTFYDQRNTELYDDAIKRAKWLEEQLDFRSHLPNEPGPGGIFFSRPRRSRKLFGRVLMYHDRGLCMVYSSALGAWMYVIARNFLKMVNHPNPYLSIVLSIVVSIALFFGLATHDRDVDKVYDEERRGRAQESRA